MSLFFGISDFQELFPGRNLSAGPLTVITVSQKTNNDMSGWNPAVDEEREHLLEQVSILLYPTFHYTDYVFLVTCLKKCK